ncbi:hypothetical protein BC628DRAFT_814297 [Trametes gibbosa]|nr:hypothetical protein BC628DRAFT_814297 [Trametes gibbosa]
MVQVAVIRAKVDDTRGRGERVANTASRRRWHGDIGGAEWVATHILCTVDPLVLLRKLEEGPRGLKWALALGAHRRGGRRWQLLRGRRSGAVGRGRRGQGWHGGNERAPADVARSRKEWIWTSSQTKVIRRLGPCTRAKGRIREGVGPVN